MSTPKTSKKNAPLNVSNFYCQFGTVLHTEPQDLKQINLTCGILFYCIKYSLNSHTIVFCDP